MKSVKSYCKRVWLLTGVCAASLTICGLSSCGDACCCKYNTFFSVRQNIHQLFSSLSMLFTCPSLISHSQSCFILCPIIQPCDLGRVILLRKYPSVTILTMPADRRRGEPEKSSSPLTAVSVFFRSALSGCSLPTFGAEK